MKLKNILFFILFLSVSMVSYGQFDRSETRKAENDSLRKKPFLKRLTYNMGGGFGGGNAYGNNYLNINLQPQVGYKIRTNLIAGLGGNYQYLKYGTTPYQIYGGNAFTRFIVNPQFFTQLEYQVLNYSYKSAAGWNDYLMIGGGYTPASRIYISAYYLLKYPPMNNIYGAPYVFRFGFMF